MTKQPKNKVRKLMKTKTGRGEHSIANMESMLSMQYFICNKHLVRIYSATSVLLLYVCMCCPVAATHSCHALYAKQSAIDPVRLDGTDPEHSTALHTMGLDTSTLLI